jgi:hypothetical protein
VVALNIFGIEPPCSLSVQRKRNELRVIFVIHERILDVVLELLRASRIYIRALVALRDHDGGIR